VSPGSCSILVLDDEQLVRENLCTFFEDEGFEVHCAASGEEALELLGSVRVRVAIVDIRLPGISGEDFIVRANEQIPELRFVIYTGSLELELSDQLIAIGLDRTRVVFKPVLDMRVLADAVARAVGECREEGP
jgi:CheY-like chemotaxis protein